MAKYRINLNGSFWNMRQVCDILSISYKMVGARVQAGLRVEEAIEQVLKEDRKTNVIEHPMYTVWNGMTGRCLNPKNPGYKNYGARGITVCEEWKTFEGFVEGMTPRPSLAHSLDRIDNSRGYYRENCRWATRREQANNTRLNNRITVDGQTKNLSEWAEYIGIDSGTISTRIHAYGWTVEEAIKTPVWGKYGSRIKKV